MDSNFEAAAPQKYTPRFSNSLSLRALFIASTKALLDVINISLSKWK
jgi:hypothetical protein